jgi:DNA polymerase III epsilon subunit family exonuclease
MREDGFLCCICRRSISQSELHVHHIIPLASGGTNNYNNLVTLCYTCHNRQHEGFDVTRFRPIKRIRHGGEFVVVDIETTGFSNNDHIIEIAAVRFKAGNAVATFESLVNPGVRISENIVQLTGITNLMLASAPAMNLVFPRFMDFISRHKLVMHNSAFDMRFLQRYAVDFGDKITNEVVDTLALARKKLPLLQNHKLPTLVSHFDIAYGQRHRARDDCIATAMVYINCLKLRRT